MFLKRYSFKFRNLFWEKGSSGKIATKLFPSVVRRAGLLAGERFRAAAEAPKWLSECWQWLRRKGSVFHSALSSPPFADGF